MAMKERTPAHGLEGVIMADTKLSCVDGERGQLVIAGQNVEDLAGRAPFERACAILWTGDDSADAERAIGEALGRARVRAHARLAGRGEREATKHGPRADRARRSEPDLAATAALRAQSAMGALRAGVAPLEEQTLGDGVDAFAELTATVAVVAAAWSRLRQGEPLVAPDPDAGHSADLLTMLAGVRSSEARVRALDAYLVTVIDHGMNASTFAARVVTSTGSDPVSAVTAAIGALKGPLHGGAPGPVLDMLDAVGSADRAREWIVGELDARRRIMGLGHRVYRVRDPRAAVLERAVEQLRRDAAGVDGDRAIAARLDLARAVEREGVALLSERHPERALRANVEFYTALLLEAIGIPRDLFSAIFAASRVAGWCAHIDEQRRTGRLIRPKARYVGALPEAHAASRRSGACVR